jgi:hypothetical protein
VGPEEARRLPRTSAGAGKRQHGCGILLVAVILLMSGCASAKPEHPLTKDGWAYEVKPPRGPIGLVYGPSWSILPISPGFFWFDSVQLCESHRAAKVAQIEKVKPHMTARPGQPGQTIDLSGCREAVLTVNEGGMWGYMKPDGTLAAVWTESGTCEHALAADVRGRIMPISQRNCVAAQITWK